MRWPLIQPEAQPTAGQDAWASACRSAALVAASFMLAVIAILLANWRSEKKQSPLTAGQIVQLKADLAKDPSDDSLRQQLRELDRAIRYRYFRQRWMAARGGWLLLAGAVALASCLKLAATLTAKPYLPDPQAVQRNLQPWISRVARAGIVGFAAICAGGLLAVAILQPPRLPGLAVTEASARDSLAPTMSAQLPSAEQILQNWPAFRGPRGNGVALDSAQYPTHWDASSGANILWKTPVPLPGHNSPIVWQDMVFCSGANEERREVYCFDLATGSLKWKHSMVGPTQAKISEGTSYAPSTLATDGRRVFAIFPTGELAAFDFSGRPAWNKNLGPLNNPYGHASSLLCHRGNLIVQLDQGIVPKEINSSLAAYDGLTGQMIWQARRQVTASWASPILAETPSGAQIITAAKPWVIAYDPASGREIWRAQCLDGEVAPSPAHVDGVVYVANERAYLSAIRCDGQGDVTKTHILWQAEDGLPDIVSPLSNGQLVFTVLTYGGHITCFDAKDGKIVWEHDLNTDVSASPVLASGRVYLLDMKGVMHIFEANRQFKLLATAAVGEETHASPAFVGGRIYIRGANSLFCIGTRP